MQNILSSKRMENGIVVFWEEKGEQKSDSFNYSELIDMKINALDLLDRPKSYKVDTAARLIISQKIPKKTLKLFTQGPSYVFPVRKCL